MNYELFFTNSNSSVRTISVIIFIYSITFLLDLEILLLNVLGDTCDAEATKATKQDTTPQATTSRGLHRVVTSSSCRVQVHLRAFQAGVRCQGPFVALSVHGDAFGQLHYHRGAVVQVCIEVPAELLGQVGFELLCSLAKRAVDARAAGELEEVL